MLSMSLQADVDAPYTTELHVGYKLTLRNLGEHEGYTCLSYVPWAKVYRIEEDSQESEVSLSA